MKKILLLFLLICTLNAYSQPKSYDYCYTNSKGTCVYAVADKKEIVVVRGVSDPSLSPDGTKLAYTYNTKDGGRGIKVIDINSKKKTILKTQSDNCYGPVWSPDGRMIAYNVFDTQKSNWDIAVIDIGNNSFKVITHKLKESYAPTWLADSRRIVVQNMDSIFVFNLSGNILKIYKFSDICKGLFESSDNRFMLSKDENSIIISAEVNEDGDNNGPPNGVFIYNISSKLTKRLTPKGYSLYLDVLKNNKLYLSGGKNKSMINNIYTVNPDGSDFKILFSNCVNISAKR